MAFWEAEQKPTQAVTPYPIYIPKTEEPKVYAVSKKSNETELNMLKKEKLAKLLDEWADGKITEEQYKIQKEKIMLL